MRNKVVLITGANRGIGQGLTVEFAKAGALVAANYPNPANGPEQTLHLAAGLSVTPIEADLLQPGAHRRLIHDTVRAFGRLDVLINNAGLDTGDTVLETITEAEYDRLFGVNLKAVHFCSQFAGEQMKAQGAGGRIIVISSIQARHTLPHRTLYAASKGGVDSLVRALAIDLGPFGITVNCIAPGFIEVERTIATRHPYDREAEGRRMPVGRVGTPRDVAALAMFLSSGDAGFLSGQSILLDGGLSCRLPAYP